MSQVKFEVCQEYLGANARIADKMTRGDASNFLIFGWLALSLSGCATWSKHGIQPRPPEKIRIAVLPVQISVIIKHLKNIQSIPKSEKTPLDEKDVIHRKMREAADAITGDIEAELNASYFFEVAPDSDVRRALEVAGFAASTATLTDAQVADFGKTVGAQAVLVTQLSGYGAVKKRWLFYLIGSGLAEGLVQGVVVAVAVSSPWAAVGIGVEEAAQETAEWGGGAFLFGKMFSPVILEGQLISSADGRTIWSGTELASSNSKAVKALPKVDQGRREFRLRLTAKKAAVDLVKKIDKKAWANLKNADERSAQPQPRAQ